MTEKRFTTKNIICSNYCVWDNDDKPYGNDEVVDLLNAQHEEITRLQKEMERVINDTNIALGFIHWKGYSMRDIAEYEEYKNEVKVVSEIEQLKQENQKLEAELKELQEIGDYQAKRIEELNEENRKLEEQLRNLRRLANEMYMEGSE